MRDKMSETKSLLKHLVTIHVSWKVAHARGNMQSAAHGVSLASHAFLQNFCQNEDR